MKYVSVAEMIAIEKESHTKGHTYAKMMEHAGRGLAEVVNTAYGYLPQKNVLGLVGSGNNGGDTLVAFAYLQEWGWQTTAYIVKPRPKDDPLLERLTSSGGVIQEIENDPGYSQLSSALTSHQVLLDGILGTGTRLPLRGVIETVLNFARTEISRVDSQPQIVAVDCPSGVDCDTGEVATACIPADLTVTMAAVKKGLLKFPAYEFVGKLKCVGIGLPEGLEVLEAIRSEVVDFKWVQRVIPKRPLDAHKSTFGVVMVLAGSVNYSGAVLLAGETAFRSGAGWVTLAVPEPLHGALAGSFIEATWLTLPHEDGWLTAKATEPVLNNIERVTAMLVGPGFGIKPATGLFLRNLLLSGGNSLPHLVLDADGLKLLAGISDWATILPENAVLTPHPGEMAVLTGLSVEEIQRDRVKVASQFAKSWGHVVVLKGAFTVIASPDGEIALIPVATPALARAGTGDVLAGLIVGLRAQGMDPFEAASAGAWIHAQAGLRAVEVMGNTASVLAGDVMAAVPDVMGNL
jgi:NAD(P)H-hydrate epimerase